MHRLFKKLILLSLAATSTPLLAQTNCAPGRIFASGYFSNVHVYDACTGAFERVLDSNGRIAGAQAVWVRPDGNLYVVSENNGRILRYRQDDLSFVDTFIDTGPGFSPTGIAFAPDGDIYVAGFQTDSVRRYDGQTGALKSTPVAATGGLLNGPDNGMRFGPDGKLYIPGYYSHNVVRYDPATGATTAFVAANAGGLRNTRAILFEEGNNTILVSGEGSNQILRFNATSGALVGTYANLFKPAGMNFTEDGRLLVATNDSEIRVLQASTGNIIGPLFPPNGSGGLQGATYAVAATTPGNSTSQVGTQYWIIGAGQVNGRTIEIDMTSATGTEFGANFNASAIVRQRWGSIRIQFDSCDSAQFSWNASGSNSSGFGTGGYPLQLLLGSTLSDACRQQGFANVSNADFMNGTWFGGESRSGEGLLITVTAGGLATVAWFTHQPAP